MGKIVILGTTNSGKTCYFYGMLRKMMVGIEGFSIRVADKDFAGIREAIKRLGDVKLPIQQRFPPPSNRTDTYKLDLLYNLSTLEQFDWDDYPGENIESGMAQFAASMRDAHCLLLCLDGQGIGESAQDLEPDEIEYLAEDMNERWGGLELNHALQDAERMNQSFPAVCVMITKYDKIPESFRNLETMTEVVKHCFPILFNVAQGGSTRLVTICPVSLGKDLDQGARLRPVNVEKPMCFAAYLIQATKYRNYQENYTSRVNRDRKEAQEYEQLSFWGKLFTQKPTPLSDEEASSMQKLVSEGEANVRELRNRIIGLPLYKNGQKIEWP